MTATGAAAMAGGRPPATVIVAARNEERHIAECLRSLGAQTWSPLEIIVVDDGSTDHTADVVRGFRGVRLIRQPHRGKAPAVNRAAAVAGGDALVFVDGDLVLEPDYVERLVAPIFAGECIGTGHATERVANPANRWAACYQVNAGLPPDRRLALTPAELAAGSVVFRAVRAADFRRVGGFDDIGYLDDQTLAPKLGVRARWVPEARCAHYNPETLREVFAAGAWAAHSILVLHGGRALGRYAPPAVLVRALRAAGRRSRPALAVYDGVYQTGVFWGLLRRVARRRP